MPHRQRQWKVRIAANLKTRLFEGETDRIVQEQMPICRLHLGTLCKPSIMKKHVHLFPRSTSDFVTTDPDRHPSYPQCISKIATRWPMACLHSAAGPWLTKLQRTNDVHSNITYFHTILVYLMLRSTTLNYVELSQKVQDVKLTWSNSNTSSYPPVLTWTKCNGG